MFHKQLDPFAIYDQHRASYGGNSAPAFGPRAYFEDPTQLNDSLGLGFRETPSTLTYETLDRMAKSGVVAIIHKAIVETVCTFARRPKHKFDIGLVVRARDKDPENMSKAERERAYDLECWILNCGRTPSYDRHNLTTFLTLLLKDRLAFDQMTAEIVLDRRGKPCDFYHVPAMSMRLARHTNDRASPVSLAEQTQIPRYVQIVQGQVVAAWPEPSFIWQVSNPRNAMIGRGYGQSELELAMLDVTATLWAEEWNRTQFSQGSSVKGVFNFKGSLSNEKLEAFRRQWYLQAAGVWNAHRQVFMNTDGIEFVPLNLTNAEMGYTDWLKFLIQKLCAWYSIAPEAVGFNMQGTSGGTSVSFNVNEQMLQNSKDRFLRPHLSMLEHFFNSKKLLGSLAPDFCLEFYGISKQDEEKYIQNRINELQHYKTLNEIRANEGLPALPHGDVPLSPAYTGFLAQQNQQAMMQQQQQPPAQGGEASAGKGDGEQPPPDPKRHIDGLASKLKASLSQGDLQLSSRRGGR